MSAKEEIQATELKLLQEYVNIIMDMSELSQRIATQLQEQNPDYIFYVGKRKLAHPCLPMAFL